MEQNIDVLVLEDVQADAELIEDTLRRGDLPVRIRRTTTRDAFEHALDEFRPDVIVSDHGEPAFDGLSALSVAHERRPDVPVIVLTNSDAQDDSLEALHYGAAESVRKDELSQLAPRVKRAVEMAESHDRIRLLSEGIREIAIYLLDAQGCVKWLNSGAGIMSGFDGANLLGRHFCHLLDVDNAARARADKWLEACVMQEKFFEEDWSRRKDGSRFRADFTLSVCHHPTGETCGFTLVMRDLTESRRTKRVLDQSEASNEAMLELTQDAFISLNEQGILTGWNGAAEKIFGFTAEQAVGREFVELIIPPGARQDLREHLQNYLVKGGHHRLLGRWYSMLRSDGTEVPVEFALTAVPEEKPLRFTGYIHDLSQLKESEAALKESEQRYCNMLDNVTDYAIYLLDAEGNVATWNTGATRIEGYQAEEIMGRHFSIFFTPEDREKGLPQQELDRATTEGKSNNQAWSVRKDGSRFRSYWILTVVREKGRVKGFVRVAHDVTQQYQTEQALRESEDRFRLAVEAVRDCAIYMLDAEGRVATYNRGATCLEGYQPEEIIGKPHHTFFTPEAVALGAPEQELERARTKGLSHTSGWNVRKDGTRFFSDRVLTAIRDANGNLTGFLKVAHDMTDIKEAQEKIQSWNTELENQVDQRTKDLEVANKDLEAFSYSVSHDLRAPLRHINAFIQMLDRALPPDIGKEAREHLEVVARSAKHMGQLVDDLLTFSRMGRQELHHIPADLNILVREAQRFLQAETNGRKIEWVIPSLPTVQGDPTALRQVFINLFSNAVKYTAPRPHTRIEIGHRETEEEIIFFVRDNGVGFDMQYAPKLFGVFQRLHSSKEFEGTGIGLAIVRRVIERHGGKTWAEGVVNEGATFYASLPKIKKSPTL